MRVVFVTHNDLGRACIEELADLGADVRAIYTRPPDESVADQVAFDAVARDVDADLHRVESANEPAVVEAIAGYEPELLFVVGWSRLVEQPLLDVPSVAALGMHPAPLPRGRGRAPIAWTLVRGLEETALSCFHLVEAADAGDLVGQRPIDVAVDDDAASLYEKVVDAGRELVREYYPRFADGEVPRDPQDDERATWWPRRRPRDGLIDWNRSASRVYDWIRGQTRPYPGAFSYLHGERVTIWAAAPPSDERAFVRPGELVYRDGDVLGVGAWEGVLELTAVGVDGAELPAGELLELDGVSIGDRFASARAALER